MSTTTKKKKRKKPSTTSMRRKHLKKRYFSSPSASAHPLEPSQGQRRVRTSPEIFSSRFRSSPIPLSFPATSSIVYQAIAAADPLTTRTTTTTTTTTISFGIARELRFHRHKNCFCSALPAFLVGKKKELLSRRMLLTKIARPGGEGRKKRTAAIKSLLPHLRPGGRRRQQQRPIRKGTDDHEHSYLVVVVDVGSAGSSLQ